jgi:CrcB protein
MSATLISLCAVASGAALGACLRWGLGLALNGIQPALPLGTLAANLAGGLLAGAAMAWLVRHPELSPAWRLFLTTGFLGGLTTFSTFSAESLALLIRGEMLAAAAHSALHLIGSLAAAALGYRLMAS